MCLALTLVHQRSVLLLLLDIVSLGNKGARNQLAALLARGGPVAAGARAELARARLLGRLSVALLVQGQVVGARKGFCTKVALERPVAGVLALVARQLVRASETRLAGAKVAQVRLFARVNSLVCLEVRAFGVNFVATWILAVVHVPLLQVWVIVALPLGRPLGQLSAANNEHSLLLVSLVVVVVVGLAACH